MRSTAFLFYFVLILLLNSCGSIVNPSNSTTPITQIPDPEEQKKALAFRNDSAYCSEWRTKLVKIRQSLPKKKEIASIKTSKSFIGFCPINENFPLFTYDYFVFPDSTRKGIALNLVEFPLMAPLVRDNETEVRYERKQWDVIGACDYIYVLYLKSYNAPEMKSINIFAGGTVNGTVVIYDIRNEKIVGAVKVKAGNSEFVGGFNSKTTPLKDLVERTIKAIEGN